MNEPLWQVHDPVLAEGDLLPFATWMLHDRHEVTDDRLALRFDERAEAELAEAGRSGGHCDKGEVEPFVGHEEPSGVELEDTGLERLSVDPVLVVEFDGARGGRRRVWQNVMVRKE